jgi:hypothetical protein
MRAGWSTLIEAVIYIARSLLAEEWLRYCRIVGGREGMPPCDEAGSVQLAKPHGLKLLEAWEAAWAGEALRLEKEFETALVQALGAERWEMMAVDGRNPLTVGKVAPANWTRPIDAIIFHYDRNAIEIEGDWLHGVQLRPVERSELPTVDDESAMPAEGAAKKAEPETISEGARIGAEADAAWEYTVRLAKERESTGYPPTRAADFNWAAQMRLSGQFHLTQDLIKLLRSLLLTEAEKKGGAPRRK